MGSVGKPSSEAEQSGGLRGAGADLRAHPASGRGRIPAGNWGTAGTPRSVHPRLPWPIAAGDGGRLPPLPDPACPARVPAGTCQPGCRSRPKIATAPPKASPPTRAARKARELLCIAAGCVQGGDFSSGKASPETRRAGGALGAEGWVPAAPGRMLCRGCSPGTGMPAHPVQPPRWLSPLRWGGCTRAPGGLAGLAKAPARARPRCVPTRTPRPLPGQRGGGVSSTRPPNVQRRLAACWGRVTAKGVALHWPPRQPQTLLPGEGAHKGR